MEKAHDPLPELIPNSIIEAVKLFSTAQLCDGMKDLGIERDGCMDADMMVVGDKSRLMIGTAYTVDTSNGNNFPVHIALYRSLPGFVLVVAGKNYKEKSYLGDLIGSTAQAIGLAGIVVDGLVRDKMGLGELDIPVFSRGFIQRGPGKDRTGRIGVSVECAGVVVNPGDLIIGDNDGVTVIPRDFINEVLVSSEKKRAYERNRRTTIAEYMQKKQESKPLPNLVPAWVKELQG